MIHFPRKLTLAAGVLAVAGLAFGPSAAMGGQSSKLDLALCAPTQNLFTLNIDNAFSPFRVGQQSVLAGVEGGENIGRLVTVLNQTETFYRGKQRVTTRAVEEREWADTNGNAAIDPGEALIEVSQNYFAQTQAGTLCYFGEAVDIYENGAVVGHAGSWRADDPGNAPGIFMPAAPKSGMTFQQEAAPGIAEDQATVLGSGRVKVPAGTFTDTIRISEFNPLDGGKGTKTYARGVGLVVDGTLSLIRH